MIRLTFFLTLSFLSLFQTTFAQKTKTDANIIGHVIDQNGQHIPFATVSLVGTTIGTTTDGTGHYQLVNLPEGDFTIKAQCLGCKPKEHAVTTKAGNTMEIKFQLEDDVLGLEEIVITGDRNETKRTESSTIVMDTETPKDVMIDGKRVTFDAREEIVLRCGKASITLTRAGKVLIRGTYLLNRSSGVNRIKGGSVQLN